MAFNKFSLLTRNSNIMDRKAIIESHDGKLKSAVAQVG